MTVPAANTPKPILSPTTRVPFTDPDSGILTSTGLQLMQQYFMAINGLSPTISCNVAFSSNVYTLTPLNIAPNVPNYIDYWGFAFVAPATSTGAASATIVPNTGSLPTLPVFKNNGGTATIAGDIVLGSFYVLYFVDSLNSGNGGLVLK